MATRRDGDRRKMVRAVGVGGGDDSVGERKRSAGEVAKALDNLRRAAEGSENTMPLILDAVRAYATVGEICGALKEVFGSYTEANVL